VEARVVRDAEEYLQRVAQEVLAPHTQECVLCYVARMVEEHDCDSTLRWVGRFRELRSPLATGLEERMRSVGGFCDCEVFGNGWGLAREHLVRDLDSDELEAPERLPTCAGVGRMDSTKPCRVWVRGGEPPRL
jgi:hypothetical protein